MSSPIAKSLTLSAEEPSAWATRPSKARKEPVLWIRTVAGPSIGFGHLRRSLTLARLLAAAVRPIFLADSIDAWTQQQVKDHGWEFLLFEPDRLWSTAPSPRGILIDTRQTVGLSAMIAEARRLGIPVASIHDLGLNPLPSDVVVDGSICPKIGDFLGGDTVFYTGPSYLALEPEYALFHSPRRLSKQIRFVIVNLGGGDSGQYFSKVLEGLRLWGHDLDVVGAPGFSAWGQTAFENNEWGPVRFRWAGKGESLADLMCQADLAITAGGLAAFEALCTGTPLFALSFDGFQQQTLWNLAMAGACIDLGRGDLLASRQVAERMTWAAEDVRNREKLSLRGQQIVDGRGAERVANIILKSIEGVSERRDSLSHRALGAQFSPAAH